MKTLNEIRDEEWLKWIKSTIDGTLKPLPSDDEIKSKRMGQPPFFAGFDKCSEVFRGMAGEFDGEQVRTEAKQWVLKEYGDVMSEQHSVDDYFRGYKACHDKDAAALGAMRAENERLKKQEDYYQRYYVDPIAAEKDKLLRECLVFLETGGNIHSKLIRESELKLKLKTALPDKGG